LPGFRLLFGRCRRPDDRLLSAALRGRTRFAFRRQIPVCGRGTYVSIQVSRGTAVGRLRAVDGLMVVDGAMVVVGPMALESPHGLTAWEGAS